MPLRVPSRRNLLAYPAGVTPGFDPSHPFSSGARFSAVFSGKSFQNCAAGCSLTGVPSGTPASINVDGQLGPAKDVGTGYSFAFTSPTAMSGDVTMAAIVRQVGGLTAENTGIFQAATAAAGGGYLLATFSTGLVYITDGGLTNDCVSTIRLVNGRAYLLVASWTGNATAGVANFVATDLLTGQIQTSIISGVSAKKAVTGFTATGFTVGKEYEYGTFYDGQISAVMASSSFHSMQEMQAWAANPWAFWYPNRLDLSATLSGGGGTIVAATRTLAFMGVG